MAMTIEKVNAAHELAARIGTLRGLRDRYATAATIAGNRRLRRVSQSITRKFKAKPAEVQP